MKHTPHHERLHDKAMREHDRARRDHPLCFRKPGDALENPLPHEREASHNQGQQHGGEHARPAREPRSETEKNRRMDARKPGSGF